MPLTEIAVAMGIPIGTVKSRLHRSLQAMRITLADEDPEATDAVPGGQFA